MLRVVRFRLAFARVTPESLSGLDSRASSRTSSYGLEDFVCTRRKTFELACNWKLFVENAMEEYHIGTVHRQTIQKNTPLETHAPETPNGQYAVLYSRHEGTMALLKGDTGFPRIEGCSVRKRPRCRLNRRDTAGTRQSVGQSCREIRRSRAHPPGWA